MANTTFTDRKGRKWDIALDLRIARLVDKSDFSNYYEEEFSILQPERKLIGKLITDGPFLFAVIWAMVQEQAKAKWSLYETAKDKYDNRNEHSYSRVTEVQDFVPPPDSFPVNPEGGEDAELEFVSGVNGPVIEAARDAMMESLTDFFPDQRTVLSILRRQSQVMSEKVGKKLEETVPLLHQVLDEELDDRVKELKEDLKTELKTGREKRPGGTYLQSQPPQK